MAAQGEPGSIDKIHRDPLFDRTRKELRALGGHGAVAAAKADTFIDMLEGRSSVGSQQSLDQCTS